MGDEQSTNKRIVQEILLTMAYGQSYENIDKAVKWIQDKEGKIFAHIGKGKRPNGKAIQLKNNINDQFLCTVYVPEMDTVKNILSKANKVNWIDTKPFEKSKILNRLGEAIENNAELLSQIEIVTRGILGKDTRNKAIPLLAQYFYYYSSYAVRYYQKNPNWKPEGIAVGIISNANVLSNIGLMLAPALAAGYNIVLQVGTKLSPSVTFILDLAKQAGIPQGVIRLIPSDNGELLPFLSSENVAILTLLMDIHDDKCFGINSYHKKILNMASYKTPLIVFDSADLDSAATCVIDSAWGYQGQLPWSVDTVLVQENVFKQFVDNLKVKLQSITLGMSNNKMADISYLSAESFEELIDLMAQAKSLGIETFQIIDGSNTPALFIGAKVVTYKFFKANGGQEANAVTLLPFRSIDEALSLANNTRQGLAASIWTENIGVINEMTKNLKVSNIWINSHGLMTADVTLSPIKDSGIGYFGGKLGFHEYVEFKVNHEICNAVVLPTRLVSYVVNAINAAKTAQEDWYKLPRPDKANMFENFAEYIDGWSKYLNTGVPENRLEDLENWVTNIYIYITGVEIQNPNITQSGFTVTSTYEPRGVIAIEAREGDSHMKLVLTALMEGNTVILLDSSQLTQVFYRHLSHRLPVGILTILPYTIDNVVTVAGHQEVDAYLGDGLNSVFSVLPVNESKIFTNCLIDGDDFYKKIMFCKNVWSNIGKSSTCSL